MKKQQEPKKKSTPQENRKKLDSITSVKRTEILRKKDSIVQRNANARGMDRETFNKTVQKERLIKNYESSRSN